MFNEIWIYLFDKRLLEIFLCFIVLVNFIPNFYKRFKKQALINIVEYNRLNYHHHSCCILYKTSSSSPLSSLSSSFSSLSPPTSCNATEIFIGSIKPPIICPENNKVNSTTTTISSSAANTVLLPCCYYSCHCQHCVYNYQLPQLSKTQQQQQEQQQHHQRQHLQYQHQHQEFTTQIKKLICKYEIDIKPEFQGYNDDDDDDDNNDFDNNLCNGVCMNHNSNNITDRKNKNNSNKLHSNNESNGFKSSQYTSTELNNDHSPSNHINKVVKSNVSQIARLFEQNNNNNINNVDKRKTISKIPEAIIKRNKFEFNTKFGKLKKNKENLNFENHKYYSLENLDRIGDSGGGGGSNSGFMKFYKARKGFDFGGSNGNISSEPPVYSFTATVATNATTPIINKTKKINSGNNQYKNNSNNNINCKDIEFNNNFNDNLNNSFSSISSEILSTLPVQSVDEILLQRRFSRPFSQYSISDLLQNSDLKDDDLINAIFEDIS